MALWVQKSPRMADRHDTYNILQKEGQGKEDSPCFAAQHGENRTGCWLLTSSASTDGHGKRKEFRGFLEIPTP